jgi:methylenetetrahydrofolate reductase (NADPH)
MSQLQQQLESGRFVFTGEIGPPKGANIAPALHEAETYLKGRVAAVNVTDIQTAVMRLGSMAVSHLLLDRGIEPVFQMVCRDRNRLALQSDLLSAAALGIENVLALTGDHVVMGDHRDAKPVYDLDSVGLIRAISALKSGTDLGQDPKGQPNQLDGVPSFFVGCCTTPCSPTPEAQAIKLEKKVAAGAQFVQTQAVYDPAAFEAFMESIRHIKVPVLVGIVVLKSAGMARYMNKNVPGVRVPDPYIQRLAKVPKEAPQSEREKVAIDISAELIRRMRPMCQGAHLMTLGWDHCVPHILEAVQE